MSSDAYRKVTGKNRNFNLNLKNLAVKKGMHIGTAVNDRYLNDRRYRKSIINEFNAVTLENEMIFRKIHPLKNKYNFGPTDKVVSFAKRNKMKVRGHSLLWHNAFKVGLPDWIIRGKFTREELIEILRSHIRTVMRRYRGKISKWTVVNEAMADNNELRRDIWLKNIGTDYIEMAFHFAHEADPKAKLYYNDYCIDDLNKKSDAVYKLMKNLLKRSVPIHGIGLQMHLLEEYIPDTRSVEKNIRRFKKLGLEVDITEMDVRIRKPITQKKLENQARIYNEILKTALKTECKTFVMWGFTDAHSWVPWWFKNYDAALIFDKNYKPKPAYYMLKEAFLS
jgi:endo-1,4-beta-xylanase